MPLRVLIVPDKFKGTLTARDAAEAIAAGWRKARPKDMLDVLPMSDGGDGFGSVMGALLVARRQSARTIDAAHRPVTAPWWHAEKTRTAIIDSAAIIGLAKLPKGKFHPFQLDSFGLGLVLKAAERAGARHVLVGIGGSATNDGGFGLARALGWRFFGKYGGELTEWWQLHGLARVGKPPVPLRLAVRVAVDVKNPLLGPNGCTRIFGPQKGLRPGDFAHAEKCLSRLAGVLKAQHRIGGSSLPGAGAAGGLGFGWMAFAGARIEPGKESFARAARLDSRIKYADLVITGEGRLDRQTTMGKGVGQIALHCRKLNVPCLALAGVVDEPARDRRHFVQAHSLTDLAGEKNAQRNAAKHLRSLAERVAESFCKTEART